MVCFLGLARESLFVARRSLLLARDGCNVGGCVYVVLLVSSIFLRVIKEGMKK